jgi:hypothetical protein
MSNTRFFKQQSAVAMICTAMALPAFAEGGLDTEFTDVHISGAVAGGFYASDQELVRKNDQNRLSDFLLGLDAATADGRVEMSGAVGILPSYSLLDHGVDSTGSTAEVQYAMLAVHPVADWTLELGRMPSNIGYEDTVSAYNAHSVASVQATTQPGYFPATRLNYGNEAITVYLEQSDDSYDAPSGASTGQSWASGAMGEVGEIEYAVGYQSYVGLRSMFNLVLGTEIAGMDATLVYDRLKLDKAGLASPTDKDTAQSVAFYLSGPEFDDISVPVRLEVFDDQGNGLYEGSGKGQSLTVTPTWNLSEHAYLRTDFSYLTMDNKILTGKNGPEDSRFMFVLQAGYRI